MPYLPQFHISPIGWYKQKARSHSNGSSSSSTRIGIDTVVPPIVTCRDSVRNGSKRVRNFSNEVASLLLRNVTTASIKWAVGGRESAAMPEPVAVRSNNSREVGDRVAPYIFSNFATRVTGQ